MNQRSILLAAALAVAGALSLGASPASADVGNNPNVFPAEDLVCENGYTSDQLLIIGRAGHVPPGNSGAATEVEVFVPNLGWITIFDVPGRGLDDVTTHCTWTASGSGQLFRGEIVLRGNLR